MAPIGKALAICPLPHHHTFSLNAHTLSVDLNQAERIEMNQTDSSLTTHLPPRKQIFTGPAVAGPPWTGLIVGVGYRLGSREGIYPTVYPRGSSQSDVAGSWCFGSGLTSSVRGEEAQKASWRKWHLSWALKVWENCDSRRLAVREGHPGNSILCE